jgi:hypothetical protein
MVAHAVRRGRIQTHTVASDGHNGWARGAAKLVYVQATSKADREFGRFLARFEVHAEVVTDGLAYWAREDGSRLAYENDSDMRTAPTYFWAGRERSATLRREPTVYRVVGDPAAIHRLSGVWYVAGRVEDVVPVRVAGAAGSGTLSEGARRRVRRMRVLRLKDGEAIPTGREPAPAAFLPAHEVA